MKSSLIILEAKNNKFSSNDQKLIDFISNSSKEIGILAVNCNYVCAKTLKKVNKIYLLATKVPINIVRDNCTFALLVAGLMLNYDMVVADTDSCYHNVICRAAAAVNRYVISNVCNILGNNIFVRTIYAGKINQHVSFKCNKPWMISVKLPLIVNSDVEIKKEKQIEEKKKINNSNKNDTCGSKVETKEQNINDVVSDKGVVDNKDKKFNDLKNSFNSRDNLVNKNKVDQEEMVRGNETISDNVVKKIEITSINNKDLNIELCGVKSKEENIDCKKGENNVVESIETILGVKFLVINFPIRKQIQLLSYSKVGVDSELPELSKADIVIAGGRSFGTEENFIFWLKPLALKLGAAIGATKGAVELGCAPDRFQIGSTGLIIAPKLYIAFGISGSDHHMVGIRDAKIIVAVNINKDAAIMSMADYFITMDMFDVISGMMKWLDNNKIMSIDHLIQNLDKNQSKPDQFKSDEQEVKSLQIS